MSAVVTVGLVILSYTIRVAVNLEGDYGKSRKYASAASCGAARSAVARREVRPSDFSDRVATWFRIVSPYKPTQAKTFGSFSAENGASSKGEMGEGWKRITPCKGSDGFDSRKRSYDVGICPQEDRRRSKGTLGEDTSREQEGGIIYGAKNKARCFGGRLFSLMNHRGLDTR